MREIKGFVAFLDILGFSQLISQGDFSDKFSKYSQIISSATNKFSPSLKYVTFSDSIIINTEDDSERQLRNLLLAVAEINYLLICELNVPICGCVSSGKFLRLVSGNGDLMIAGPPIVEAYRYEQQQNWIGVMLSPSVLSQIPALKRKANLPENYHYTKENIAIHINELPWPLIIQRNRTIPFHKESSFEDNHFDGWVVIPQLNNMDGHNGLNHNLIKYQNKLDELKGYAPSPHAQKKYQSSLNWIGRVRTNYENNLFSTPLWTEYVNTTKI